MKRSLPLSRYAALDIVAQFLEFPVGRLVAHLPFDVHDDLTALRCNIHLVLVALSHRPFRERAPSSDRSGLSAQPARPPAPREGAAI